MPSQAYSAPFPTVPKGVVWKADSVEALGNWCLNAQRDLPANEGVYLYVSIKGRAVENAEVEEGVKVLFKSCTNSILKVTHEGTPLQLRKNTVSTSTQRATLFPNESLQLSVTAECIPVGTRVFRLSYNLDVVVVRLEPFRQLEWQATDTVTKNISFSTSKAGNATLTFTIQPDGYPEGYSVPNPVKITILELRKIFVTASVNITGARGNATLRLHLSSGPQGRRSNITLKPQTLSNITYTPPLLTWSEGEAGEKTLLVVSTGLQPLQSRHTYTPHLLAVLRTGIDIEPYASYAYMVPPRKFLGYWGDSTGWESDLHKAAVLRTGIDI